MMRRRALRIIGWMLTAAFATAGVCVAQDAAVAKRDIDLAATDGVKLKASYFAAGKPGPGVLLLHQCNQQRKNWEDLASRLAAAHPSLAGRLHATGGLPPADASRHLQACDVLVQPYPDGVSGRRSSAMAGLGHGVAVATNRGRFTEPCWSELGDDALAPSPAAAGLIATAERLLADPDRRARVAAAGRDLHEKRFAIGRAVEAILGGVGRES